MVRLFELIGRLAASDLPVLVLGETGAGKEGAALAVHHWLAARQGPVRRHQLRRDPREPRRERAVRPREGRLHRRRRARKRGRSRARTAARSSSTRSASCRCRCRPSCCACSSSSEVTRVGGVARARGRRARRRRDQPRPRGGGRRRALPPGSLLPPRRGHGGAAAAARAAARDRRILARRFLAPACARGTQRAAGALAGARCRRSPRYAWPGNVRELRNVMEYVAATVEEDTIEPWHLPEKIASVEATSGSEPAGARRSPPVRPFRAVADELRELERTRMHAGARSVRRRAAPRRRAHRHAAAHLRHEAQAIRHLAARATRPDRAAPPTTGRRRRTSTSTGS